MSQAVNPGDLVTAASPLNPQTWGLGNRIYSDLNTRGSRTPRWVGNHPEFISGVGKPQQGAWILGLKGRQARTRGWRGGARRPAELRDKGPRADVAGPGGPFKRGGRAARGRAGAGRGGRRRRRQRLVLGDSDRFGPVRPARRWARKTAMPPRRSIVEVKVLDVQKRRVPNKHYVSLRPRHAATPAPGRTCAPRPPCRLSPLRAPGPRALPTISPRVPGPRALPAISSRAPALPTRAKVWPQPLLEKQTNQERDPASWYQPTKPLVLLGMGHLSAPLQ